MRHTLAILIVIPLIAGCGLRREAGMEVPMLLVPDGVSEYQPTMTEDVAAKILVLTPPVELEHCESPYDDGGSVCGILVDLNGKAFPFVRSPIFSRSTRYYKGTDKYSGMLMQEGDQEEQALVALVYYWFNRRYTPEQQAALRPPRDDDTVSEKERVQIWKAITCRRMLYAHGKRTTTPDPFETRLHKLGVAVSDVSHITNGFYRVQLHQDVADLSPLKGLPLMELSACNSNIVDLTPLEGMPLRLLWLHYCGVGNLNSVQGMKLEHLNLTGTQIADLTPLRGMPLKSLILKGTKVRDLSPLAGMLTLTRLDLCDAPATDLSPLAGLHLDCIDFCPTNIMKGIDSLRQMDSLRRITPYPSDSGNRPEYFWRRFDSGEFRQKKPEEW